MIVHFVIGGASDVNICSVLVMSGWMFQVMSVYWYDVLHDWFMCMAHW